MGRSLAGEVAAMRARLEAVYAQLVYRGEESLDAPPIPLVDHILERFEPFARFDRFQLGAITRRGIPHRMNPLGGSGVLYNLPILCLRARRAPAAVASTADRPRLSHT